MGHFQLLSNIFQSVVSHIQSWGMNFNGTNILIWGVVPFVLTAVCRFVFPMLHLNVAGGILTGGTRMLSSAANHEYTSDIKTIKRVKNVSGQRDHSNRSL